MAMTISIWDDEPQVALDWKRQIEGLLGGPDILVKAFDVKEIDDELRILHRRREAFLRANENEPDDRSELDDTHVLIVDNDLFSLRDFSDFSAEMVATRAGVYTDCGMIVVLNINRDIDFDLTLLGNPDSKADLHINDRFVADPGLWERCPKEGGTFRPWHWPLLLTEARQRKDRVDELHRMLLDGDLNVPILDYLQFPEEAKQRLSRFARAFLHPVRNAEKVSFKQFVDGNVRAVALRDGERIAQRADIKKIARIGARRIYKWLAHLVLGPQDILIDFPHLIEKLSFLVPPSRQNALEYWNSCASMHDAPLNLVNDELSVAKFQFPYWVDRPTFWSHDFERADIRDRLLRDTDSNPKRFVFCEDSSAFHPSDLCHRFVAAHNTASDDRFVRWLHEREDFKYGPQSRLAI